MNYGRRVERLQRLMGDGGLRAFVLYTRENLMYFTGFDRYESTAYLLIPLDGDPILYVTRLDYQRALDEAFGCRVKRCRRPLNTLSRDLTALGGGSVGVDDLPSSTYTKLQATRRVNLKPSDRVVWRLRSVKEDEEVKLISEACKIACAGMEAVWEALRPGLRECELAGEACRAMMRMGSEEQSFPTIVASGPRSAYPHGGCTRRRLRKGELVVVDLGASYMGYKSDMTRTFVAGRPSDRQVEAWRATLEAYTRGLKAMRVGIRAGEVDRAARRVLEERGFGRFFIHGLGHGIGLSVHEPPYITKASGDRLSRGNVVTCEPGVYIPGFGGVRLENTVLVSRDGVEELTRFPMELC